MPVLFLTFVLFASFLVSASPGLNIESVTLTEPSSGIVGQKDSVVVSAIIKNVGTSDLTSSFWVKTYVNNRMVSSCSDQCELNYGIKVSEGLKVGQSGEIAYAGYGGDTEYFQMGENEVKFVLGADGQDETIEKSVKFNIVGKELPSLDLSVSNIAVNLKKGVEIESIKVDITNLGPNFLKNDVLQVSLSIKSEDDSKNIGNYGGFVDMRSEFCNPSTSSYDCVMGIQDINVYSLSEEQIVSLNSKLSPGKYKIIAEIDDVNGLKNFKETNKDNSKKTSYFEILDVEKETLEPAKDKPVEVPQDTEKIVYLCSGCMENNLCYSLGYRKDGFFCSENTSFIAQLESDVVCQNNFECSSNVCVSGKCISESFIQKILNWFKNLFG